MATVHGAQAASSFTGLEVHENGWLNVPYNYTYTLIEYAAYACDIISITCYGSPGSVGTKLTLSINGTPITGINNVTVNAGTQYTFTASGANSLSAGGKLTMTLATVQINNLAFSYKTIRT